MVSCGLCAATSRHEADGIEGRPLRKFGDTGGGSYETLEKDEVETGWERADPAEGENRESGEPEDEKEEADRRRASRSPPIRRSGVLVR
jgi:hypothetical protein